MSLHTTDASHLLELWTAVRSYIPAKERSRAAEHFIQILDESELVDLSVNNQELFGICDVFDASLEKYLNENGYTNEFEGYEDE